MFYFDNPFYKIHIILPCAVLFNPYIEIYFFVIVIPIGNGNLMYNKVKWDRQLQSFIIMKRYTLYRIFYNIFLERKKQMD